MAVTTVWSGLSKSMAQICSVRYSAPRRERFACATRSKRHITDGLSLILSKDSDCSGGFKREDLTFTIMTKAREFGEGAGGPEF